MQNTQPAQGNHRNFTIGTVVEQGGQVSGQGGYIQLAAYNPGLDNVWRSVKCDIVIMPGFPCAHRVGHPHQGYTGRAVKPAYIHAGSGLLWRFFQCWWWRALLHIIISAGVGAACKEKAKGDEQGQ